MTAQNPQQHGPEDLDALAAGTSPLDEHGHLIKEGQWLANGDQVAFANGLALQRLLAQGHELIWDPRLKDGSEEAIPPYVRLGQPAPARVKAAKKE